MKHGYSKYVILLFTLIFLFFAQINFCQSSPCPNDANLKLIHMEECVKTDFIVNELPDSTLCWQKIDCGDGHLRKESGQCGPKCKCPEWTDQCSFFNGNSTNINIKVEKILENERIDICSLEPNEGCSSKAIFKEFNQIQLFDGKKYLVKDLNIEFEDLVENNFECVGKGAEVSGSPRYCKEHHCATKSKKFCFYPRREATFFVSPEGKLLIKAWGK